jgi:hypothetical protein
MNALEFTIDLANAPVFTVPKDVAAQLPKAGKARVILLTDQPADPDWQAAAYQQFLRDDSPEDEIYESLR